MSDERTAVDERIEHAATVAASRWCSSALRQLKHEQIEDRAQMRAELLAEAQRMLDDARSILDESRKAADRAIIAAAVTQRASPPLKGAPLGEAMAKALKAILAPIMKRIDALEKRGSDAALAARIERLETRLSAATKQVAALDRKLHGL